MLIFILNPLEEVQSSDRSGGRIPDFLERNISISRVFLGNTKYFFSQVLRTGIFDKNERFPQRQKLCSCLTLILKSSTSHVCYNWLLLFWPKSKLVALTNVDRNTNFARAIAVGCSRGSKQCQFCLRYSLVTQITLASVKQRYSTIH